MTRDFTWRLRAFSARAAAIATLLADLKSRRLGDVSAAEAVVGDRALWLEVLAYWREKGWVVPAPHSPLYVFPGPDFPDDLELPRFCGEEPEPDGEPSTDTSNDVFPKE
jgi:hypothetical protein